MPARRVALYGHDTLGLGHLRRNLALAECLGRDGSDVLIITGAAEALWFPLPPRADVLVLPGVAKDGHGDYASRHLSVGLDDVVGLRRAVLRAALSEYAPDLLVVDKLPLGFAGELEPALKDVRRGPGTRVVLGLRDVLDEPAVAHVEWCRGRMTEAVRQFFDQIWVYGDPRVHDVADACGIPPSLRAQIHYTGYLSVGRIEAPCRPPMLQAQGRYAVGLVGGGRDGGALAAALVAAPTPSGVTTIAVTGPQMRAEERGALARRVADRDDVVLVPFSADVARWLPGAAAVVTMGGYNTVAEVLSTTVPALVVPRRTPRAEQVVRADALAARGLVDVLPAEEATAGAVGAWLAAAVAGRTVRRGGIDLDGLARVPRLAAALLDDVDAGHALAS